MEFIKNFRLMKGILIFLVIVICLLGVLEIGFCLVFGFGNFFIYNIDSKIGYFLILN